MHSEPHALPSTASPDGAQSAIEPALIFDFAQTVWSTVLGADLTDTATGMAPGKESTLTGRVRISGAWEGTVAIECSPKFAAWAAARMFDATQTSTEEVHDALGELTNMVGGNLKALLPGPSRLSVPEVGDSDGAGDGAMVRVVRLDCDGEPIVFKLFVRPNAGREEVR